MMVLSENHQRFKGHFLNDLRVSFKKITILGKKKKNVITIFFFDNEVFTKINTTESAFNSTAVAIV